MLATWTSLSEVGIIFKSPLAALSGGLLSCLMLPCFLGFLISGMVLRWRHVGRVCTGSFQGTPEDTDPLGPEDYVYMKSTGSFMHWYLIITSVVIVHLILLPCCLICYSFGKLATLLAPFKRNRTANSLNI